jgi:hypothetical protein
MSQPAKKPQKPKSPSRKKALSPHYKANNAGGYGNAPVKSQFKPGCKPGPGRKKGEASIEAAMRRMLREKVPRKDGGPPVPIGKAFAAAARNTMLTGGVRGVELGLKLSTKFGEKKEADPIIDLRAIEGFNNLEMDILIALHSRVMGEPAVGPDNPDKTHLTKTFGLCRVVLRSDGHIGLEEVGPEDAASSEPLQE